MDVAVNASVKDFRREHFADMRNEFTVELRRGNETARSGQLVKPYLLVMAYGRWLCLALHSSTISLSAARTAWSLLHGL